MDSININEIKNTTDYTKQICYFTFISIILVIIFTITPLKNLTILATLAKLVVLLILGYAIYLNYKQTNMLKTSYKEADEEFSKQLSTNITTCYVFTVFLAILFIFVVKNIFIS
jgi:hypothetical protein